MKIDLKKTFLRVVFFVNIVCLVLLLASDLSLFLDPEKWWVISLTGLIFPLLFILMIIFVIFWLFFSRRKALISLVAILISFQNIRSCFAFHFSPEFSNNKQSGNIRILTWNVGLMNYEAKDSGIASQKNAVILNALHESNADVICLQEFFTAVIPGNHYNLLDSICHHSGYPYYYFSFDHPKFNAEFYSGSIIFSKYPIVDSSKVIYPKPFVGSIIRAGLLVNNDTIDVFTTRLESVHFLPREYKAIDNLKKISDSTGTGTKKVVKKLRYGYEHRTEQINIVKELMNKSTRVKIFTGDMNDVPASYTYHRLSDGMQDAWISKGFGMGRTFRFISPTLRIDHILYDERLHCLQIKHIITNASDHYGLVADLQSKK